jgi:hypothetical protein
VAPPGRPAPALTHGSGAAGGLEEHARGDLESFDATEGDVFVLDVDEHAGVDRVQRGQPGRPVDRVVAAAQGDEVPGGGSAGATGSA